MRYVSPLRYPGGKAGLTRFLTDAIDLNDLRGCAYYEPYAGGAGAALGLLRNNVVSKVFINDADKRVYAFWISVLQSSELFVKRVRAIPLTIDEWHQQHAICRQPDAYGQFDVGFAAFFMNRCNRSGVLTGSGPIGGFSQSGKWQLDARFNRDALSERILALGRLRQDISVTCFDAIEFLKKSLPRGPKRRGVFVYLDPPYVSNGQRLYLNAYKDRDHSKLARYLDKQQTLSWLMSYDDNVLIRSLYSRHRLDLMPIRYSLQEKRSAQELIIAPPYLTVPQAYRLRKPENLVQPTDGRMAL